MATRSGGAVVASWAVREFVVARNPEEGSTLPYLVRLPLPDGAVVLKVRDVWPRTAKVYCHRAVGWPDDPEIVDRAAVRVCHRRGAAVDLVLERSRENRSQFVFTRARGRDVIFWQSARTSRQARPNVALPTARASGQTLEILVDSHERYPWTFTHQQATTRRQALPAGDYAVDVDGIIVAAVERKSLADLISSMTTGKLRYLLADLAALQHAAVVVEDRYSAVFKLVHVRPAIVADGLGEAAAQFPAVPIVFAETRPLAQEWTYRFLGAALVHHHDDRLAATLRVELPPAGPVPAPQPTTAEVRAWARLHGLAVPDRGRLRPEIWSAYRNSSAASEQDLRASRSRPPVSDRNRRRRATSSPGNARDSPVGNHIAAAMTGAGHCRLNGRDHEKPRRWYRDARYRDGAERGRGGSGRHRSAVRERVGVRRPGGAPSS